MRAEDRCSTEAPVSSSLAGVIAEQQTVVTLLLGRALPPGRSTPEIEKVTRALFGHLRSFEDVVLPVLGDSEYTNTTRSAAQRLADDLAIALTELHRSGSAALYEHLRGASARLFAAQARLLRDPVVVARIAADPDLAELAEEQFASTMGSDRTAVAAVTPGNDESRSRMDSIARSLDPSSA